jgi:primosomal protein N' (replication factor Y)
MPVFPRIIQVAVPAPLYRRFDYLGPAQPLLPGMRVRVPFGRRQLVGVVLGTLETSELPQEKLKRIGQVLDDAPVMPAALLKLLNWAADYYHHPIGDVIAAALPTWLRQGRAASIAGVRFWTLTEAERRIAPETLKRAPARKRILEALATAPLGLDAAALVEMSPSWATAIKTLAEKGWVAEQSRDCLEAGLASLTPAPQPNSAQQIAIETVAAALNRFQCFLLHGVTGSGKTEVYLRLVEQVLAQNRQALVLVPEIGLTPQLVNRFRQRFSVPIALLHSGLNDQERLCAWLAARDGRAPIVLGTRSAVFAPLKNPGLIVVDEEHDSSYKQQDGFRYSARDCAVMRAAHAGIPVVLGSATPALESLKNARDGTYQLLDLPDRTGGATMPTVRLLDMRVLKPAEGLSHPLRQALAERLAKGEQSLLFLNRRGFSPVWMCHDCGWIAPCHRCDARLTFHKGSHKLRCHHCHAEQLLPPACPKCGGDNLHPLGEGTERIEQALQQFFPQARIERIDRDSTRRKGALEEKFERVHAGAADILVGTQMLTKGHDFPNVTLVGVLNADQGLFSPDFHASERLFQQIVQVSGRAGRADKPGEVLIQTWHPDHPVFAALQQHDFSGFVDFALAERRETEYPPFGFLALLRAESPKLGAALGFLAGARELARACPVGSSVQLLDPVPAPMERRGGRYRAQLLVQSKHRAALHRFLNDWVVLLAESKPGKTVRWSLDVDPIDLY